MIYYIINGINVSPIEARLSYTAWGAQKITFKILKNGAPMFSIGDKMSISDYENHKTSSDITEILTDDENFYTVIGEVKALQIVDADQEGSNLGDWLSNIASKFGAQYNAISNDLYNIKIIDSYKDGGLLYGYKSFANLCKSYGVISCLIEQDNVKQVLLVSESSYKGYIPINLYLNELNYINSGYRGYDQTNIVKLSRVLESKNIIIRPKAIKPNYTKAVKYGWVGKSTYTRPAIFGSDIWDDYYYTQHKIEPAIYNQGNLKSWQWAQEIHKKSEIDCFPWWDRNSENALCAMDDSTLDTGDLISEALHDICPYVDPTTHGRWRESNSYLLFPYWQGGDELNYRCQVNYLPNVAGVASGDSHNWEFIGLSPFYDYTDPDSYNINPGLLRTRTEVLPEEGLAKTCNMWKGTPSKGSKMYYPPVCAPAYHGGRAHKEYIGGYIEERGQDFTCDVPKITDFPWAPFMCESVYREGDYPRTYVVSGVGIAQGLIARYHTLSLPRLCPGWDIVSLPPSQDPDCGQATYEGLEVAETLPIWFDATAKPDKFHRWRGMKSCDMTYELGTESQEVELHPDSDAGQGIIYDQGTGQSKIIALAQGVDLSQYAKYYSQECRVTSVYSSAFSLLSPTTNEKVKTHTLNNLLRPADAKTLVPWLENLDTPEKFSGEGFFDPTATNPKKGGQTRDFINTVKYLFGRIVLAYSKNLFIQTVEGNCMTHKIKISGIVCPF